MVRSQKPIKQETKGSKFNLKQIRSHLKEKLLCPQMMPFQAAVEERKQLSNLLRRTIELGESNSALLIGPRGCGKTALVNDIIDDLRKNCTAFPDCVLVHLNGYVHTDDRFAIKSITSQLNLDNNVAEKVFASFAENLTYLLKCLRDGNRESSKSVLFLLDEFDLFCSHRNQTLLYNLFDVAQSAQAPVCVVGITSRNDVTELFEKRVLSRFSNRQIYLYPDPDENEDKHFNRRLQLVKDLLSVDPAEKKFDSSSRVLWNKQIDNICADSSLRDCLRSMLETTACERTLRNILYTAVSSLDSDCDYISPEQIVKVCKSMTKNNRVMMLEGLTVLELCLIISMKHHTDIYDGAPFNFEMVLSRYLKFAYQNSNMINVDRQVILKAFEHLKNLELMLPVASANPQVLKEFQMFHLIVQPDEIQEAVRNFVGLPTEVSQWAMSDLT